jgi:hypothetical protein
MPSFIGPQGASQVTEPAGRAAPILVLAAFAAIVFLVIAIVVAVTMSPGP